MNICAIGLAWFIPELHYSFLESNKLTMAQMHSLYFYILFICSLQRPRAGSNLERCRECWFPPRHRLLHMLDRTRAARKRGLILRSARLSLGPRHVAFLILQVLGHKLRQHIRRGAEVVQHQRFISMFNGAGCCQLISQALICH